MSVLCKLVGHRPSTGYTHREGAGYFKVEMDTIDGVGTQHARLYTDCDRCGQTYRVGMIHVPKIVSPLGDDTRNKVEDALAAAATQVLKPEIIQQKADSALMQFKAELHGKQHER